MLAIIGVAQLIVVVVIDITIVNITPAVPAGDVESKLALGSHLFC
ncbi:hypothetical protein [Candidatus Mycolicibacterium alkanivorans]|nr:hypothetical protein [Candidatus Mycolicibacterium alkanivorans]